MEFLNDHQKWVHDEDVQRQTAKTFQHMAQIRTCRNCGAKKPAPMIFFWVVAVVLVLCATICAVVKTARTAVLVIVKTELFPCT